jgi:hypothetical protein
VLLTEVKLSDINFSASKIFTFIFLPISLKIVTCGAKFSKK